MNNRLTGKQYEDKASRYLENNGYTIIERNFRVKIGEIDIIAKDGDYICFIEVKYRKSDKMGKAYEAVTRGKRRRIISAAKYYVIKNHLSFKECYRFDVLTFDGEIINLYKGAFSEKDNTYRR